MPKIRFLQNYTVKAKDGATYTEGQVVAFPNDSAGRASARHFTIRQLAVDVADAPAPTPPPAKPPETEKADDKDKDKGKGGK